MGRRGRTLLVLAGTLMLTSMLCVYPPVTPTPKKAEPATESLGTIRRDESRVQYGPSMANLEELTGTRELLPNSALRVSNGGEARLVFSQQLELRAYNNADMSVSLSSDPSPYLYRLYLERSVVTGKLTERGQQIIWETPSGVQIIVSGTEFFVAYDPLSERTFAGNFGGDIELIHPSLPGGALAIPPGSGHTVPGGAFSLGGDSFSTFQTLVDNLTEPLDVPRGYLEESSGSGGDDPEPPAPPDPPAEDTVSLLFVFGGELDQADVPEAMLYAVPWEESAAEIFGARVELYYASVENWANPEIATGIGFDQEVAFSILGDHFYMATPPLLSLIVIDSEAFAILMELAVPYFEELGLPVSLRIVPREDFFDVVATQIAAGENVWALGPGP